jgi:hypothetical protein
MIRNKSLFFFFHLHRLCIPQPFLVGGTVCVCSANLQLLPVGFASEAFWDIHWLGIVNFKMAALEQGPLSC